MRMLGLPLSSVLVLIVIPSRASSRYQDLVCWQIKTGRRELTHGIA